MSDSDYPPPETRVQTVPLVEDIVLQVLANRIAENEGVRMSMTVIAGGKLVTGEAVSRNEWLQAMQAILPHAGVQQMVERIEIGLRAADAEREHAPEGPVADAGYLNFLDAFVDGLPATPLRITLSSVTGWGLGYQREHSAERTW